MRLFHRSNVPAAETSWAIAISIANECAWVAMEVEGLDPDAPVDAAPATNSASTSGTTIAAGATIPASTTYDGLAVALHAVSAGSTTPSTLSAQTNGYAELVEVGQPGAANAITLGVSTRPVQSLGVWNCDATSSTTLTATDPGNGTVVVFSAAGAHREPNIIHFWGFKVGTAAAGLSTGVALAKYWETQTGSPAIAADGLDLVSTAAAENISTGGNNSFFLTGQVVKAAVAQIKLRFNTALPGADLVVATVLTPAGDVVLRYVTASQKLGVKISTGSEVLSDATVTAGGFLTVDLRLVGTTTAYNCDWQLDYGAGPVAQTDATFTAGAALVSWGLQLGWTAASTGNVTVAHAICSIIAGHYPLGTYSMVGLGVDPAGTLTISGTAGNFQTFTANGTMAAWNATTARGAIDELPPTVGASADGFAQITLAASDYVEVPMATHQAAPDGATRALRMCACGWATSTTAATIGFRGWDGSAETTLFAAADPEFDNTTTPGWVCKMYRPAGGWDQAKLDALAFRVGFSGDATPDIGIHAIYAEVAVEATSEELTIGEAGGVEASTDKDTVTGATMGVTVVTPAGEGATLNWDDGTPGSQAIGPADTHTEVFEGVDASTVAYVEVVSDNEDPDRP